MQRFAARGAALLAFILCVSWLSACGAPETPSPRSSPPKSAATTSPSAAPNTNGQAAPAPPPASGAVDVAKINEPFRHVTDVNSWVEKFEQDHREICAQRVAIAEAVGLKPGMKVADVGAGTGLFEPLFSTLVGPGGKVYALDISPEFVDHIKRRALVEALQNVDARRCPDDSTGLPAASVDVVFVCDVYHHFEHPEKNLASIRSTLAEGGRLVLVDFDKVEGKSSDFVLHHVRAGKSAVIEELASAGFQLDHEVALMKENYLLVFRRK
jgi:ubiquinone/menaquinone biosynthesis C-methylase UbiE